MVDAEWKPVTRASLAPLLRLRNDPGDRILDACVTLCNDVRSSAREFVNHVEVACLAAMESQATLPIVESVRKALELEAKRRQESAFKVHTKDTLSQLTPGLNSSPQSRRVMPPTTPQRGGATSAPSFSLTPSPATEASLKYRDRTKRNVASSMLLNTSAALASAVSLAASAPATAPTQRRVEALLFPDQAKPYRYMSEKLVERSEALDQLLDARLEDLREVHGFPEPLHPGIPRQSEFATVGRVCAEPASVDGLLDGESAVYLEASREVGHGARVRLDLSALEKFSLFPGQVVGVEGVNASGHVISVTRMVQGAAAPPQHTPWHELVEIGHSLTRPDGRGALGGTAMRVITACGPFTLDDNLDYEPLQDLLSAVTADPPDVVILGGPFLDADHPLVLRGELPASLDDILSQCVVSRIAAAAEQLKASTQFIVVPSIADVAHPFPLLPQPPFASATWPKSVLCYPNPACFSLNEVVFAVGTVDVLLHLGEMSVQRRAAGEKTNPMVSRAEHIVQQRSMYPIVPPHVTAPVNTLQAHALELSVTPDVLVLPSQLAPFAREVIGGCVAVNPGRICKRRAGGTYAKVSVFPVSREGEPAQGEAVANRVNERISVELVWL